MFLLDMNLFFCFNMFHMDWSGVDLLKQFKTNMMDAFFILKTYKESIDRHQNYT